jgi:hypothetical protein
MTSNTTALLVMGSSNNNTSNNNTAVNQQTSFAEMNGTKIRPESKQKQQQQQQQQQTGGADNNDKENKSFSEQQCLPMVISPTPPLSLMPAMSYSTPLLSSPTLNSDDTV